MTVGPVGVPAAGAGRRTIPSRPRRPVPARPRRPAPTRLPWLLLGVLVLAQICYPLTTGPTRARLTVATVLLGYLLSVSHALLGRGPRVATALVLVTTGGGFAVEALGVATGIPFGRYDYSGALGPQLAGVPLVIPLAWTWMAWPAWLAAVRLTRPAARDNLQILDVKRSRRTFYVQDLPDGSRERRAGSARTGWGAGSARTGRAASRVLLAGLGLAAWDVFLDPQMVSEGYWTWYDGSPTLPGVPGIPLGNYLGWLLVAVVLMALLRPLAGPASTRPAERPGESAATEPPARSTATERPVQPTATERPAQPTATEPPARPTAERPAQPTPVEPAAKRTAATGQPGDAPMYALYLWTYVSSVLAHAVFLGLPASALWGAAVMGTVAVPLAVALVRSHRRDTTRNPVARDAAPGTRRANT